MRRLPVAAIIAAVVVIGVPLTVVLSTWQYASYTAPPLWTSNTTIYVVKGQYAIIQGSAERWSISTTSSARMGVLSVPFLPVVSYYGSMPANQYITFEYEADGWKTGVTLYNDTQRVWYKWAGVCGNSKLADIPAGVIKAQGMTIVYPDLSQFTVAANDTHITFYKDGEVFAVCPYSLVSYDAAWWWTGVTYIIKPVGTTTFNFGVRPWYIIAVKPLRRDAYVYIKSW